VTKRDNIFHNGLYEDLRFVMVSNRSCTSRSILPFKGWSWSQSRLCTLYS